MWLESKRNPKLYLLDLDKGNKHLVKSTGKKTTVNLTGMFNSENSKVKRILSETLGLNS